jgi:two-component system, OmpR family, phosphate regulon sensor histidine kinase PhoR
MQRAFGLTARIFLKLIATSIVTLLVTILGVDFLASRVAKDWYIGRLTEQLSDKARMLAVVAGGSVGSIPRNQLEALAAASKGRVTAVSRTGLVIADSSIQDAQQMENHASRPEVASALGGASGSDIRRSSTTRIEYLYVAVPSGDGALRLAVPFSELDKQVSTVRLRLASAVAAAFIPVALLCFFLARSFSRRLGGIIQFAETLADGNFEERLPERASDELGLLSQRLNETAGNLQAMFAELEREQRELQRLENVRKDFVINVSHELRTPLASIQGYAETLLDGALEDPGINRRFITIIKQNAERLTSLTADLLTLSRVEMKTQRFQMASYYACALMRDSVDSVRPLADKKRIEIVVEQEPKDAEVFGDSHAFHQIMTNLADNAIKYTPENGKVYVGAREVTKHDQKFVEFWVQDTGIGIPADDLPRLFERFYRVDKARSRELGGTGLGLAIVKHLVRSQGGEVFVDSEVGKGSRFTFTLPVEDLGMDPEPSAVLEEIALPK